MHFEAEKKAKEKIQQAFRKGPEKERASEKIFAPDAMDVGQLWMSYINEMLFDKIPVFLKKLFRSICP